MRLMLVSDSGEVIDTTTVTAEDLQQAKDNPLGAQALLRDLG